MTSIALKYHVQAATASKMLEKIANLHHQGSGSTNTKGKSTLVLDIFDWIFLIQIDLFWIFLIRIDISLTYCSLRFPIYQKQPKRRLTKQTTKVATTKTKCQNMGKVCLLVHKAVAAPIPKVNQYLFWIILIRIFGFGKIQRHGGLRFQDPATYATQTHTSRLS